MNNRKDHWENVYQHKQLPEVSWYEPTPTTSLQIIQGFNLAKDTAIIDIGGGDSLLADHLLELGYTNVTVLDISAFAIERAKRRLGEKASRINWIVSDMLLLSTNQRYDLWHDRAAFHFLTDATDQQAYIEVVHRNLKTNGYLVLSTFAIDGPDKCSGLPVKQYSENTLAGMFSMHFEKIKCFIKKHHTPFQTIQQFMYCSFQNR